MTTIAAIFNEQELVYGANAGLFEDGRIVDDGVEKWVKIGEWSLGICGQRSILSYAIANCSQLFSKTDCAFEFLFQFRKSLINDDFGYQNDDASYLFDVEGLLAKKGVGLWDFGDCLSPIKVPTDKLWAKGSGAPYAFTSDRVSQAMSIGRTNEQRVRDALECAVQYDGYSPGKIETFSL